MGVIGNIIFFAEHKEKGKQEEIAYVMSVSSMNDMAGTQKTGRCAESQKTLDIQKVYRARSKGNFGKDRRRGRRGTPLFTYDTVKLGYRFTAGKSGLRKRVNNDMENQKAQIAQLEKEKKKAPEKDPI